jgi:hypothetical protein
MNVPPFIINVPPFITASHSVAPKDWVAGSLGVASDGARKCERKRLKGHLSSVATEERWSFTIEGAIGSAIAAAKARTPDRDLTNQDLGGMTLPPGTYSFSRNAALNGKLILDAEGDEYAVWTFQVCICVFNPYLYTHIP